MIEFSWRTCMLGARCARFDCWTDRPGMLAYVSRDGFVFFEYPWDMEACNDENA